VLFHWSGGLEAVSDKAHSGKVALAESYGGGLDETRGGRRPRPPGWADLGQSWANMETNPGLVGAGYQDDWAEIKNGLRHYFFQFFQHSIEFKSQGFKCFQTNLN
jgi:hypothetical protein